MNALRAAFSPERRLLMPFLVAGYPDRASFSSCVESCVAEGADVLEIGLPFSDPVMDGPVIAAASQAVLDGGARFSDHLEMLRAAAGSGRPCVAMTYYNLLFHKGLDRTATSLVEAGAAGAIVPDLPVEAAGAWREACAEAGLATVFLASQTSTEDRLRAIGEASTGFVYAASLLGVTGTRDALSEGARTLVGRIRAATDAPVALGIGVSTPQHAAEAARFADGVIVGSALVSAIGAAADPGAAAGALVGEMRAAIGR